MLQDADLVRLSRGLVRLGKDWSESIRNGVKCQMRGWRSSYIYMTMKSKRGGIVPLSGLSETSGPAGRLLYGFHLIDTAPIVQ